jgi:hypothetical protein
MEEESGKHKLREEERREARSERAEERKPYN